MYSPFLPHEQTTAIPAPTPHKTTSQQTRTANTDKNNSLKNKLTGTEQRTRKTPEDTNRDSMLSQQTEVFVRVCSQTHSKSDSRLCLLHNITDTNTAVRKWINHIVCTPKKTPARSSSTGVPHLMQQICPCLALLINLVKSGNMFSLTVSACLPLPPTSTFAKQAAVSDYKHL